MEKLFGGQIIKIIEKRYSSMFMPYKRKYDKVFSFIYKLIPFLIIIQFRPGIFPMYSKYFPNSIIADIDTIWKILQIGSFSLIFIAFIVEPQFNRIMLIYSLAVFTVFISSVTHLNPLSRFMSIMISPISVILSVNIASREKIVNKVVKTIYWYHLALITINYLFVLLFPDSLLTDYRGMKVTYLFGNYQGNFNWFVVFIFVSAYVREVVYNRSDKIFMLNFAVYTIILLTSLKVWSVTAIISTILTYLLIVFFYFYPKITKYLNIFNGFILGFITTIFIGFFEGLSYFSFLIENVFKKNVTMGSRVVIWEKTLEMFLKSPIIGNGLETTARSMDKIGKATAHNHYLNLLYTGGVIYFLCIALLVYITNINFKKSMNIHYIHVFIASFIGYFVYYLTEARLNLNEFILMVALSETILNRITTNYYGGEYDKTY